MEKKIQRSARRELAIGRYLTIRIRPFMQWKLPQCVEWLRPWMAVGAMPLSEWVVQGEWPRQSRRLEHHR